ncbi:hypothetical protein J6590_009042 [Homalodisca vitripennis]|nr:hypothetical protein J6590_009042 [Homalodisca vitripennis]
MRRWTSVSSVWSCTTIVMATDEQQGRRIYDSTPTRLTHLLYQQITGYPSLVPADHRLPISCTSRSPATHLLYQQVTGYPSLVPADHRLPISCTSRSPQRTISLENYMLSTKVLDSNAIHRRHFKQHEMHLEMSGKRLLAEQILKCV